MRRSAYWIPTVAVYGLRDDLVIAGRTWVCLYAITCLSEAAGSQFEASITMWPPVTERRVIGQSSAAVRRLLREAEKFGYTIDGDSLNGGGVVRCTKSLADVAQLVEEIRRIEATDVASRRRAHVAPMGSRHSRREDASAPFWAMADAIRNGSRRFKPTQASYACAAASRMGGHEWQLHMSLDVQLDPELTVFAPPFISRIWVRPSGVVDNAGAARLRAAGIYRRVLLVLARQGFHGRWSTESGLNTLAGQFEKLTWTLQGARADVKRLTSLRRTLPVAIRERVHL